MSNSIWINPDYVHFTNELREFYIQVIHIHPHNSHVTWCIL